MSTLDTRALITEFDDVDLIHVVDKNDFSSSLEGTSKRSTLSGFKTFIFESPDLTGTPTAPTLPATDSTTALATTACVDNKISSIPLATGVILPKNEVAHGLAVGNWVRFNGTVHVLAQADNASNAEVVGVVVAVDDVDNFKLQINGYATGLFGLSTGVYFLSPTTPGALTTTEPSIEGQVSKPLINSDSSTSGYMLTYRGQVI